MSDPFSIAAVVILYNPPQNVIENIKSYYDFVERIYVFDNSENSSEQNFSSFSKIEYYHDFENAGIAKRLNTACSLAINIGYYWLLTMDQDTSFPNDQISQYLTCIEQYDQQAKVALFGTKYSSRHSETAAGCGFVEADNLITSGMVASLVASKAIGDFDENLFIDSIDHDYVIRAKIAGYKVIQLTNIIILHSLGEEVQRASLKTLYLVKKKKIIHSPFKKLLHVSQHALP